MRVLILLIVFLSSINAQLIRYPFTNYRGFSKIDHIRALVHTDPSYVELFSNSEIEEQIYEIAGTILPKRITLGEIKRDPLDSDELYKIALGQLEAPVELRLFVSIRAKEMKSDRYYGYLELSLTEMTKSSFIESGPPGSETPIVEALWHPAFIQAPFVQRQKIFINAEKKDIRNILRDTSHDVFSYLLNLMLEEP